MAALLRLVEPPPRHRTPSPDSKSGDSSSSSSSSSSSPPAAEAKSGDHSGGGGSGVDAGDGASEFGRVLIDGVDIRRVPVAVLRRKVAILPQDPTLFSGTIRSNLDPGGEWAGRVRASSIGLN